MDRARAAVIEAILAEVTSRLLPAGTKVLGGVAYEDLNAIDELSVVFRLTLTDPEHGDTWPFEDTSEIRHTMFAVARQHELDLPISVSLAPETDLPLDDDELAYGT